MEEWRQTQLLRSAQLKIEKSAMEAEKEKLRKGMNRKGKIEHEDRPFPPTILSGQLYEPPMDGLTFMDKLGIEYVQYSGHLVDLGEEATTPVVDIKILDPQISKQARATLKSKILQDSKKIWQEKLKETNNMIALKLENLESERVKRLADYESKTVNLNQAVQFRIERLPIIHQSHANEAKFLLETIQEIRERFSKEIQIIHVDIRDFSERTLNDTNTRLQNCGSVPAIKKLKDQFQELVDEFNFNVSEDLERASQEFDHGKKMLVKSKSQGSHSSGWAIIKESRVVDPNTIVAVMEGWKANAIEEITKFQKEVGVKTKSQIKEFEYYVQDYELVENLKSKMRKLYLCLKGEVIWCQNQQEEFQGQVDRFCDSLENANTWRECLDVFMQGEAIENAAILLGQYLCITPTVKKYESALTIQPTVLDWKSWIENLKAIDVERRNRQSFDMEQKANETQTEFSISLTPKSSRIKSSSKTWSKGSLNSILSHSKSKSKQSVKNLLTPAVTNETKNSQSALEPEPESSEKKIDKIVSAWIETMRKGLVEKYEVFET